LINDIKKSKCVVWYSVRCPFCNSPNTKVTNSNQKPYRYNKCLDCKRIFQSYEANYEPHEPPYNREQRTEDREQKTNDGGQDQYLVDDWVNRAQI